MLSKPFILNSATFVPPTKRTIFDRNTSVNKLKNQKSIIRPSLLINSDFFRHHASTQLLLSKKKATPTPVKKIQVKMLKYVEGTGHVGDVVMVTPAFFQNKLRPSASAIMITDEEVMKEKAEAEARENETRAKAEALKEQIVDISLSIVRKAGPDGHLFGGIGPKCIMDELSKVVNNDFLKQKGVKIVSITNDDGVEITGDIKHTGVYKASINLSKEIYGSFRIVVQSDS